MAGEEDDFLSAMVGKPEAESESVEKTEPVEAKAAPEVEKVAEAIKPEVAKVETTSTESDADKHVPLAALMAERDKRKEAARRAEELENRIKELEGQRQANPVPDFFHDPEAYVQTVVQRAQHQAQESLYSVLEETERERHADFDEVMELVMAKAWENPAIATQILKGKNPAAQAYKVGKRLQEFEKSQQDPDAYRAQLKAELIAEFKKEQELEALKAEKSKAIEASIPPDLSSARSADSGAPRTRNKSTVIDSLFPKT